MGICLELAFPNQAIRRRHNLGRTHKLNSFVDAVLHRVFQGLSSPSGRQQPSVTGRRKIVFSSFEPNICTAINWKQPNCGFADIPCGSYSRGHADRTAATDPVFFMSNCGLPSGQDPDTPGSKWETAVDARCASVDAAVTFVKANNLLGVLLHAYLLVCSQS